MRIREKEVLPWGMGLYRELRPHKLLSGNVSRIRQRQLDYFKSQVYRIIITSRKTARSKGYPHILSMERTTFKTQKIIIIIITIKTIRFIVVKSQVPLVMTNSEVREETFLAKRQTHLQLFFARTRYTCSRDSHKTYIKQVSAN
ncbi:hypothetical protein FGO68_gene12622 [Halteria grandinella]|uniref:Uncharacterized protein n=1 Tax=Halteria grandinella TaxID=5974 RepID=A0A8J8T9H3_HALGN|nr:hypothetical protein FGO68_gene12622 [Halteria grandinella]